MSKLPKWGIVLIGFLVVLNLVLYYLVSRYSSPKRLRPSLVGQTIKSKLFSQEKIAAVSDFPGYSLTIVDRALLEKYLEQFGFWEKNKISLLRTNEPHTAKALVIHWADESGPYMRTVVGGRLIYSFDTNWEENILHLRLFLNKEDAIGANEEEISQKLDKLFLQSVHFLTYPHPGLDRKAEAQQRRREFADIWKAFEIQQRKVFQVKKI